MEAIHSATYKLVKRIKDSDFDVDQLHNYCLSMQIGIRDFQLCITDTRNHTCLLIEDYILQDVKTINARLQVLAKLFENHHLLMAGFWHSIKLSLKSHKFSLVPATHFVEESVRDYLLLNCTINDSVEGEYTYRHSSSNVVNAFAGDKRLVSWINSLYPNKEIEVIHQGSTLIEGILKSNTQNDSKVVYSILDRGIMHIFVSENHKLHYYNQFSIKEAKDYVKYIMLVFKEFNLSQRTQKVVLWGNVTQNSEHYKMFSKYIGNISFGKRPSQLKFNYHFDELADHQYFDLLSVYLCD
ncbi:MAG: DUF3822 family protein [Reichenbachiella sp.]|uniref:DUF3822 family protein n=1 Tax=Reichenbachiella sp. TaxID=2184521 RepID=UPI00326414DA